MSRHPHQQPPDSRSPYDSYRSTYATAPGPLNYSSQAPYEVSDHRDYGPELGLPPLRRMRHGPPPFVDRHMNVLPTLDYEYYQPLHRNSGYAAQAILPPAQHPHNRLTVPAQPNLSPTHRPHSRPTVLFRPTSPPRQRTLLPRASSARPTSPSTQRPRRRHASSAQPTLLPARRSPSVLRDPDEEIPEITHRLRGIRSMAQLIEVHPLPPAKKEFMDAANEQLKYNDAEAEAYWYDRHYKTVERKMLVARLRAERGMPKFVEGGPFINREF
ncbi:MAG: hypothetical protein Q9220_000719 [cf. Caloplaca sp. 1 TL-2023]